jgi:hypothetical protein
MARSATTGRFGLNRLKTIGNIGYGGIVIPLYLFA